MNNIALNFAGLITVIVGISCLAFVLLAQHHSEKQLRSALRWFAVGLCLSIYSSIRTWLAYSSTSIMTGGQAPIQHHWAALLSGVLMLIISIPQVIRMGRAKISVGTKFFTIGLISAACALILLAYNFLKPVGLAIVISVNSLAVIGFILPGYAALRLRARYPGTNIEALIIAGGLFAISMTIIMMVATNTKVERGMVNDQTSTIGNLVEKQVKQHLTKDSLDADSTKGKQQLKNFLEEIDVPELLRIKIIRADGLVLASDLDSLVGTRVMLNDTLNKTIHGEITTTFAKTSADLPETEKNFINSRIVAVPITFTDQTILAAVQLFFNAPSSMASIHTLQDAVNFAGVTMIITIIIVLSLLLQVFRKSISRPFAEILNEMENMHMGSDTGEHRRIKVKHNSDFTVIADTFNHFINEYEQRIRDMKQLLDHQKWDE